MHLIDVHILRCPDDDPALYNRMIDLLSSEPINIQEVPGVPGNLPLARKNGYLAGSAKYVTYVDPDDEIQPGIFSKINSVLAAYPDDLVVVNEEIITPRGPFYSSIFNRLSPINALHHLCVYKRESITALLPDEQESVTGFEIQWLITYLLNNPNLTYLDLPGYKWLQRENSFSTQRRARVDPWQLEESLYSANVVVRVLKDASFSTDDGLVDEGALYRFKPIRVGGPPTTLELVV